MNGHLKVVKLLIEDDNCVTSALTMEFNYTATAVRDQVSEETKNT
jgi:hypothetical protein